MKGIYLTEQAKQEIEAKIAELEEDRKFWLDKLIHDIGNPNSNNYSDSIQLANAEQALSLLQEILSSATILPVGESWEKYVHPALIPFFEKDLKNGVIIQPKQQ